MRLFVMVQGDEIIVTSTGRGFIAQMEATKPSPVAKVRRCTETENHELLAKAWQAANAKARELGWIV